MYPTSDLGTPDSAIHCSYMVHNMKALGEICQEAAAG